MPSTVHDFPANLPLLGLVVGEPQSRQRAPGGGGGGGGIRTYIAPVPDMCLRCRKNL